MTLPRHQQRWEISNGVAPSIYFGLDRKLCGIYILEFTGGDRYVGQTVDLTSRLAAHRHRWKDIIAVSFLECGPDELDHLERTLITQTERSFPVRNKAFTKMPSGDAEIDLVVDRQEQAEWLDGVQPAYPLDERTRAAERRRRTRAKFEALVGHPAYPEALEDLAAYVHEVIPWPSVTGGLYWGVSAMPSTSRTKDRHRLFTVNAHNVELLYLMHYPHENETDAILNVASSVVTPRDRRDLEIRRQTGYRSYRDCETITLPAGKIAEVLERLSVLTAARTMALGLMRRGPSNFAKFHSDALLDEVLLHRDAEPMA